MDPERICDEIKILLEKMTFAVSKDAIETHQGMTSRFSVRLDGGDIEDEEGGRIPFSNIIIGERGGNLAALEHILKKILKKKIWRGAKIYP